MFLPERGNFARPEKTRPVRDRQLQLLGKKSPTDLGSKKPVIGLGRVLIKRPGRSRIVGNSPNTERVSDGTLRCCPPESWWR